MLVKLGLSVDQCIDLYKLLSSEIFGHWNLLGYLSGGFGKRTKFSGDHLKKILIEEVIKPHLKDRDHAEKYLMEDIDDHLDLAW